MSRDRKGSGMISIDFEGTKCPLTIGAFNKIKDIYGRTEQQNSSKQFTVAPLHSQHDKDAKVKLDTGLEIEPYLNFWNRVDPMLNMTPPVEAGESALMKESILSNTDVFTKVEPTDAYMSRKQRKLKRKEEREKTAGEKWFNMAPSELTEEDKMDVELLGMRDVIYEKKVYKKAALKSTHSKYLQVGTYAKSPYDFYADRSNNNISTTADRNAPDNLVNVAGSQGKGSIVQTLLQDVEFRKRNKERFLEAVYNRSTKNGQKKLIKQKFGKEAVKPFKKSELKWSKEEKEQEKLRLRKQRQVSEALKTKRKVTSMTMSAKMRSKLDRVSKKRHDQIKQSLPSMK